MLTILKFCCSILVSKMKGGYTIKNNYKTCQEWLPFDKILDDGIIVSNNHYIKVIKIFPINYELKSNLEREAILNSYKLFLKVCDFDFQILIQSRKENFNSYISKLNKQILEERDSQLSKISKSYIDYIQNKNSIQNSSPKNFYILISSQNENYITDFNMKQIRNDLNSKYLSIKDALSRCGNIILDIDSRQDVEKIMLSFYNFRKCLTFI